LGWKGQPELHCGILPPKQVRPLRHFNSSSGVAAGNSARQTSTEILIFHSCSSLNSFPCVPQDGQYFRGRELSSGTCSQLHRHVNHFFVSSSKHMPIDVDTLSFYALVCFQSNQVRLLVCSLSVELALLRAALLVFIPAAVCSSLWLRPTGRRRVRPAVRMQRNGLPASVLANAVDLEFPELALAPTHLFKAFLRIFKLGCCV
jgi:hypothetical protein